jgi:NADH-quinone oxidoreductase subunit C
MDASAILDTLRRLVPRATFDEAPAVDMPAFYVDRDHLVDVCLALRDDPGLQFALLAELTAVDLLPADPRFEVVYLLACLGRAFVQPGAEPAPARRLRVKVRVPGADARVPSVTGVWPVAGWLEREVFDLFGIAFDNHPDLRRLLMPEDWEGHPLRKDYPVQIRKDTQAWEPIQLSAAEFVESVRAARAEADRQAHRPSADTSGEPRHD